MFNYSIEIINYKFCEISAWDNTEPLNTGTVLPPVNPWDVASSEPVESTGWANFENFENTLSIENTANDKKTICDELKTASEMTAANLIEKDIAFSESFEESGGKSRDCISNQVIGTDLPAMETNPSSSSSKIDEDRVISADENINSNKLPDNRYLYKHLTLSRLEYNVN